MEEESGNNKTKPIIWIVAMVIVAAVSFAISMFIFRSIGYDEGVRFAVTSGSKQGYTLGFEMGYEMRDSIAKQEMKLRESDQFNLNIIEQEAGRPQENILVSGSVIENEVARVGLKKHISIRIISTAQFIRYKEMVLQVRYLDKRNNTLKDQTITPDEILYPGKTVVYEISYQEVPEFTESVDVKLISAAGVD